MKRLLIIYGLLMCALFCQAQTSLFYASDQLSSAVITSICQDKTGFIWVATENGLNRFDGYRFIHYYHQAGDSTSLLDNVVTHLFCDRDGRLWVGTNRGLQLYDPATEHFKNYTFPNGWEPRISEIIHLSNRQVLVGTSGYGLFQVQPGTTMMKERKDLKVDSRDEYFNNLYEESSGGFWKSGANRFSYTPKGRKAIEFDSPLGNPTDFFELDGYTVALCRDGFLAYDGKAMRSDFIDISAVEGKAGFRTAIKDKQGNIYVGTRGNGLYWIPSGTHRMERYPVSVPNIDINASKIWALALDNQGNIWVGCQQKGLLMIPGRKSRFSSWSFSDQKVDIGTYVSSLCKGDNGITWCVVQNKGVYGFNADGQIVHHPQGTQDVEMIYRDTQGKYWIGTGHGVFSYDPLSGHKQLLTDFACDKFNYMVDDGHGHFIISAFAKGILVYDQATHAFVNYDMNMPDDPKKGRLCNNWVVNMMTDHDGRIWIGTSSGLSCYDPEADTFKPFGWRILADKHSCNALCETRDGDILIGTEQGIYVWRRKSNKLEPLPGAKQLQSLTIGYIIQDNKGDLWCSTSNGIWHYQAQQKHWVSYVRGAGLRIHEYVNNSGLHTSDDRIYFPNSDGITTFLPQQVVGKQESPGKIQLTGFYIDGNLVSTLTESKGRQVTKLPVEESDHFTVSYSDNTFSLYFSLLNFADAANTIFEYRMGSNDEWHRNEESPNAISFYHLPSGTYHLEVRAIDNGVVSETKTYTIVVTSPWYQTTWAYLFYVLAAAGLLALIAWEWRHRMKLRTEEDKMKFLINATHDIRSPLTLIMGPLEKLKAESEKLSKTTAAEFQPSSFQFQPLLDTIERNAKRILSLVNQILDVRKIDKHQMHLHCQKTDMQGFIQSIYKVFEYNARERNINFHFTVLPSSDPSKREEPITVWIDQKQFDKVISNLLSNAFKYTGDNGEISITLSEQHDEKAKEPMKDYIEMTITDTGTGLHANTLQHLFDRFYQGTSEQSEHVEGTGIGLNLCKMIVDMHHGSITGRNRDDGVKGSVFTVRLPQGNSHLTEEEIEHKKQEPTSIKLKGQKASTRYKVLIVDDDEEIPQYINQELGNYYNFYTCRNGKDGLKELLLNEYHLVISDVMMPEMDGFTMLRMIRTNGNINHLPVIMLTSKTDIGNRLEGLERGADAYLTKPFSVEELHATIDNLITSRLRLRGKYTGAQKPVDQIETIEVKGNDEQLMERIVKCINEHIGDSTFNVEVLCQEVGISRANLHRKMKALAGISSSDFIRNIRMEQAARLLSEQKLNITQVAYAVGYSNLSYFSTAFKKHFGISPTEYVEKNNN
ncbi:MAG: helix-turn-helix domain-containing protein [Prevotella sp.]|nr:helix-turn-helix domain-containing protein [Prevotella sp.]